jgi:hypothetical protein
VGREWCLVVRPKEDATADERQLIDLALAMREPSFDFERDGADVLVFGDAKHSVVRLEKAVLHTLAESGVAGAVIVPLWVGRWDGKGDGYVFPAWIGERQATAEREPVVSPDEIRWSVSLAPRTAFEWQELRDALRALGRLKLSEDDHRLEVGARDHLDAQALLAELRAASLIRDGEAKPMTRFRRWRVRQQLLGNYVGAGDPTIPP